MHAMWRRLLHPTLLRPAASAIGLGTLSTCQPPASFRSRHCNAPPLSHSASGQRLLWCSPKQHAWMCSGCATTLPRDSFPPDQHERRTRQCKSCVIAVGSLACTQCHEQLPPDSFAQRQRGRSTRTCIACCSQKHCCKHQGSHSVEHKLFCLHRLRRTLAVSRVCS